MTACAIDELFHQSTMSDYHIMSDRLETASACYIADHCKCINT